MIKIYLKKNQQVNLFIQNNFLKIQNQEIKKNFLKKNLQKIIQLNNLFLKKRLVLPEKVRLKVV